ncbi:hypothetical protein acdb102_22360 [Acidothermaceae bacterium B102]|nr:hypothetical protein acdb102_22360 [Acidothermaceae bacterium B102]
MRVNDLRRGQRLMSVEQAPHLPPPFLRDDNIHERARPGRSGTAKAQSTPLTMIVERPGWIPTRSSPASLTDEAPACRDNCACAASGPAMWATVHTWIGSDGTGVCVPWGQPVKLRKAVVVDGNSRSRAQVLVPVTGGGVMNDGAFV